MNLTIQICVKCVQDGATASEQLPPMMAIQSLKEMHHIHRTWADVTRECRIKTQPVLYKARTTYWVAICPALSLLPRDSIQAPETWHPSLAFVPFLSSQSWTTHEAWSPWQPNITTVTLFTYKQTNKRKKKEVCFGQFNSHDFDEAYTLSDLQNVKVIWLFLSHVSHHTLERLLNPAHFKH